MKPNFGRVPSTGNPETVAFFRKIKERAEHSEAKTTLALQAVSGSGAVTRTEFEALKAFLRDYL